MRTTVDMPTREDWELLGLRPDACVGDVRAAWRRLSRQTHPDAGGTDALFRRVTEAYERVLADVEDRDRNGPRRHAASEKVTPESPSADVETHGSGEGEATTGPDAQERLAVNSDRIRTPVPIQSGQRSDPIRTPFRRIRTRQG